MDIQLLLIPCQLGACSGICVIAPAFKIGTSPFDEILLEHNSVWHQAFTCACKSHDNHERGFLPATSLAHTGAQGALYGG